MTYHLYLGMVGDDFTGSSDAASFAAKSGLKTMLFDGIPQEIDLKKEGVQAAIIALKSRMAPVEEAKQITLEAAKWLRAHGAEHIYSKYCSTFDSTPKGNIGPILDNFLEHFGAKASFLCPCPALRAVVKTNDNIHSALMEIECMCVSLASVADNSYFLVLDD